MLCAVMEYCDCGTLARLVAALRQQQLDHGQREDLGQQQRQSEAGWRLLPQLLPLLLDVARGLQLLHSRRIVHGDLVSLLILLHV